MKRHGILAALAAGLMLATAVAANAAPMFNRVASFPVELNKAEGSSSSEIIAASDDGMTLVYSDSPGKGIGFVDITDPKSPKPAGYVATDGEPTSVTVVGAKVYAAVNTSANFVETSGQLLVIDLATKAVEQTIELGGQPDSIARNTAGTLLAIAIENERDEDLGDGGLPQMPAGFMVLLTITDGKLDAASLKQVEMTGLAETFGEDPEPEFTAINDNDEVAVTLQENNHIVIVDGKTGTVVSHFSAGATTLEGIDTKRDGAFDFTSSKADVLREPDGIKWLDNDRLFVANEGDWNGGARGFTIFGKDGTVLYESGASMEMESVRMGHYPDHRSSKGAEPEGVEAAQFGDDKLFFVALERASLIAVYKDTGAEPEYLQSLPSGISPEGIVAIPSRNLIATANEVDLREDGLAGSHVMIYERTEGETSYPQLVSGDAENGRPIGWAAISGAVVDADTPTTLYAVSDSVMATQPSIYTIDASVKPARIVKQTVVKRGNDVAQKLDLEGITLDGKGGFWLASEGRSDRLIPHALYNVDADGKILAEVAFPEAVLPHEIRFGAEGVAMVGDTLWVAIQREWKDDAKGEVKLLGYNTAEKTWSAVRYPLEAPAEGTWNGLSEITLHGDYVYIIERDNQIAAKALHKKIYRVPVAELQGVEIGGELPLVSKELVRDLVPDLAMHNGYVVDKVESLAIAADGTAYAITDNDGIDDSSGETFFWSFKLD